MVIFVIGVGVGMHARWLFKRLRASYRHYNFKPKYLRPYDLKPYDVKHLALRPRDANPAGAAAASPIPDTPAQAAAKAD